MANQLGQGDAWADYQTRFTAADSVDGVADTFNQPLAGNFNQLKELKAKYPNLKVTSRWAAGPGRSTSPTPRCRPTGPRSWRAASTCSSRATCR